MSTTAARRAAGATALGLALAALAPVAAEAVTCTRSFDDVPGIPVKRFPFHVTALRGADPAPSALTCARGKAVIQRGFDRFGEEALSYDRFGALRLRVGGDRYVLARPVPLASGSHAWRGAGTRVQYALPTGR